MENVNEKAKVRPIVLTDTETGEKYVLEYTRESVKFAESRGFDINDLSKFPMSKVPEMFFYAFRCHHRNISREKTDKILFEDLGGIPDGMLERLAELYAVPFETLTTGENKENPKMTVEF